MKARSAKAKGTKFEHFIRDELADVPGIQIRRQPGSGIYADFPHDIHLSIGEFRLVGECKHWKHGWRTGDKAIGSADILFIRRNHGPANVYMTLEKFKDLLCYVGEVPWGDGKDD